MEQDSVNTINVENKKIWLLKCPSVVSRLLQSSPVPNDRPVAKVTVSIDPLSSKDADSAEFTMELTGSDMGNVPKYFSMDISKDFAPMLVFSESEGECTGYFIILDDRYKYNVLLYDRPSPPAENISVEGKIVNKFDTKPHTDAIESYGKFCRERTDKSMVKNRQVQMIGNEKHFIPMPGITHVKEQKKVTVKAVENKRTRRDRGQMEEWVFRAFESRPNWTLKELLQKTYQPETYMKDILKDLCVYNKKGANQGTYELKPEYRRSVGTEDPPTGS